MPQEVTDPEQQRRIVAGFVAREERWKRFRREAQPPAWLVVAWGATFILCSVAVPGWVVYYLPEIAGRILGWRLAVPSAIVGFCLIYAWQSCRVRALLNLLKAEAPTLPQRMKDEKIA